MVEVNKENNLIHSVSGWEVTVWTSVKVAFRMGGVEA